MMRLAWFSLLAIALIAGVAFMRSVHEPARSTYRASVETVRQAPPGQTAKDIAAAGAPLSNAAHAGVSPIPDARTFSDLERTLAKNWDTDPDANEIMRTASLLCEGFRSNRRRPAKTSSDIYVSQWLEHFCGQQASYHPERYLERSASSKLTDQLFDADWKPRAAEQSIAEATLENSTSPYELRLAANFLTSPAVHWNYGADLVQGTPLQARLPTLQREAIAGLACAYSADCGPTGVYTIRRCAAYGICSPWTSYSDVQRSIYSPLEMNVIDAIKQRLLSGHRPEP